jgi:predicted short-subunit dehydrogenase-like oxidoreductase (DUF2520 family)
MNKVVSIIGAGVVGCAVGRLLRERGFAINGVVARGLAKAERSAGFIGEGIPGTDPVKGAQGADWVFITTPDKAIRATCETIAAGGGFKEGALVVHMSGALSSGALESARKSGARVVSLHPIQSLASAEQAVMNLPGSYVSLEGDPDAMAEGREIVDALGGLIVVIPSEEKALYHAGAAVASNYLVAVVDFAVMIFESLGMEKGDAVKAVMPLIRGTVNNIARVGVPDALTGPIARGDVETVLGHVGILGKRMPEMLPLYNELGRHAVAVGLKKGTLGEEDAQRLLTILKV